MIDTFIWVGLVLLFAYLALRKEKQSQVQFPEIPAPQVNVNLRPLESAIRDIPGKVLHSIQSSVNVKKGALGELIGYIELEAQYDRIIPLGNIVDFVCIKLPTKDNPGCIDFVDVKTGKNSRLSKEQRALQQLVSEKKINFVKLTVNTQSCESNTTTD